MKYVREPVLSIDPGAIRGRVRTALAERTAQAYLDSVSDIYDLLAEVENVSRCERVNRAEFADLLAKARTALATVSEASDGDAMCDLRVILSLHNGITADELDAWRAAGSLSSVDTKPNADRKEAPNTP